MTLHGDQQPPACQWSFFRRCCRVCLLHVVGAIMALLLACVVASLSASFADAVVSGWHSHSHSHASKRDGSFATLPKIPTSDHQMAAELFRYISRPSSGICRRQLRLGGTPVLHPARPSLLAAPQLVLTTTGDQVVCLDPPLALTAADCLVYTVRDDDDQSLEAALHRYGCEVHRLEGGQKPPPPAGRPAARVGRAGAETVHEAALSERVGVAELRAALGHARRQLALLVVTAPRADRLVLRRPDALRGVQQVALRLRFADALAADGRAGRDAFALLRRRYRQLLELQRLGFRPLAFQLVGGDGAANMTVPGFTGPLTSALDVTLLNINV